MTQAATDLAPVRSLPAITPGTSLRWVVMSSRQGATSTHDTYMSALLAALDLPLAWYETVAVYQSCADGSWLFQWRRND